MVGMSDILPSGQRVLQQLLQQPGGVTQQLMQMQQSTIDNVDQELPVVTPDVRLELFADVLDEIDGGQATTLPDQQPEEDSSVLAQALPIAVQSYQDPSALGSVSRGKEQLGGGPHAVVEQAAGVQYVEVEPTPELPPEVESYIEQVVDHAQQQPEMVVVAEEQPAQPGLATPPAPRVVKVLPLTKMQEELGLKKNPQFSVRWLVEFSHKIAKMFFGGVIYRQTEQ